MHDVHRRARAGVGLGLLAGYTGGKVDTAIMRLGDVFFALPGLPMLIMINATIGGRVRGWGWLGAMRKGLRIDGFPDYFRRVRRPVAVRLGRAGASHPLAGAGAARDGVRHRGPRDGRLDLADHLPASPAQREQHHHRSLSASLGAIAGTEIALSWFGVGVHPPTPSFGAMLFEGGSIRTLQANPHLLLVPGVDRRRCSSSPSTSSATR